MNLGLFTDAFLKWSLTEVLDWLGRVGGWYVLGVGRRP